MEKRRGRIIVAIAVVLLLLCAFGALFIYAQEDEAVADNEASAYETGTVVEILKDTCEVDESAEGAWRGDQTALVEITSGKYAGKTFLVENYVGILTDYAPAEVGQSVVLHISTDSDGQTRTTLHSPDREIMVYVILGLFVLITVLVGGKTGAKSILGLVLTVAVLFLVYLPLLAKGWDPILTAFLLCSMVCIACFLILGGCSRKILCACLGTIGGMALAMLFGIVAQKLLSVDGYQAEYADALYNERITGTPFSIRGLIIAGVIISSLGAVMDVAMSISSATEELKRVNPSLTTRQLWSSGMNIGRDMVGTMTNTLILAILGSSLMLILYIHSMDLAWHQFISSSFVAIEVVSSVASAVGVILAVPLTTLAGAFFYGKKTEKQ